MPQFQKGAANPRYRSPQNPAGAEAALDGPASTPEEIAAAEKDKQAILAGITAPAEPAGLAPAGAPINRRPEFDQQKPFIPSPVVDVETLTKARQARLAEIDAKGRKARELAAELAEQEKNAAALVSQMKAERLALVIEKERVEEEAAQIQREITRADALAAATALERATADQRLLVVDEKAAWKDKVKTQMRPLVERAQQELTELLSIQGGSSEVFGRAAAYKVDLSLSQIGDGGALYYALEGACEACHKINEETKASIAQCQRALAGARQIIEHLPPDTADGRLRISRVTTDLVYCKDHAYAARSRTDEAIRHFSETAKAAAPYLKTATPVRPDVVVNLSGEQREQMHQSMLRKSFPPQQTHAAGMNTDPLA